MHFPTRVQLFLIGVASISLLFGEIFSGCAAKLEFQKTGTATAANQTLTAQNNLSKSLIGSYTSFNYGNFYSLSDPNPSSQCAGDQNSFYDPFAATLAPLTLNASISDFSYANPVKLQVNINDPTTTIRPAFVKNISVDMTDANAPVPGNFAQACSYGSGTAAPPVSSCASFDYGAIDGIPSTLGGTLLFVGGIGSVNYSGVQVGRSPPPHGLSISCGYDQPNSRTNQCTLNAAAFALSVNSLPASEASNVPLSLRPGETAPQTPISSWANITATTTYQGPSILAGASAIYNSILKKILFFGGASVAAKSTLGNGGITTYDTWIYDMRLQKWTKTSASMTVDTAQQTIYDYNPNNIDSSGATYIPQLSKAPGTRALFGYAAIPGAAISEFSSTGLITGATGSGVDTTDRIFIAGGYGGCNSSKLCSDIHRFNPTYGPEYMDTQSLSPSASYATNATSNPTQWMDSYHTQLLSNSTIASQLLRPSPIPSPQGSSVPYIISFGFAGLNNNFPFLLGGTGLGVTSYASPLPGSNNTAGAAYLVTAGGFYGLSGTARDYNTPFGSCATINQCGGLQLALKWFNAWNEGNEHNTANFASVSNFLDTRPRGIPQQPGATPVKWTSIYDGLGSNTTPWYGSGSLLKGINVPLSALPSPSPFPSPPPGLPTSIPPEATNQLVFFGGADCREYLTSGTACPNWDPNAAPTPLGNPGRYWIFGPDPAFSFNTGSNTPVSIPMAGSIPLKAGMATARGLDGSNHPIIVAWGGMSGPAKIDTSGIIHYLYYNNLTNQPTWATFIPSAPAPSGVGNASLTFSHITGKFYLFGGMSPSIGTYADTWELSVTSTSCGVSNGPTCQFTWRPLSTSSGMTCYPNCPPARRSHRMVEANYHYFNAPFEPDCSNPSRPCSFGLFMEGGTPDGVSLLSDRWMFDPTANGGNGNWQLMGEMPPRTLASMANIDYVVTATGAHVHRAILFGGETGMQDANWGAVNTGGYFVPPTLGDTWMYDFDHSSWNRVSLNGHRYDPAAQAATGIFPNNFAVAEARSSYFVNDTNAPTVFSPPPLSGGIMVTRTQSNRTHADPAIAGNAHVTPLAIPEVFLFGGRKKDGSYNLLSTVYKFCAGSTGEKPFPTDQQGNSVPLPDDASCDAFDSLTNPGTLSPTSGYNGRWLVKNPPGTGGVDSTQLASFMGAGAYDTVHDIIVLFGGLTPNTAPFSTAAVTDSSNRNVGSLVLEYTPPSAVQNGIHSSEFNGSWAVVPACATSPETPVGRYGHSIGYDPLNHSLIVVGGYDVNGNPLTQEEAYFDGTRYSIPEVWSARRIDQSGQGPLCYEWNRVTAFGNSLSTAYPAYPNAGLSHAASVFIPSSGFNSGYYTTLDSSCINSGPISSTDSSINKLLVGGAYFDIDRSQLGSNENLILNLTIFPLGTSNIGPNQNRLTSDQSAIFKVHLVKTGQSGDIIRRQPQPRNNVYAALDEFPEIVQNLSILTPPTGQIRQEQIIIPISIDPGIDRIRIERYSGSAILINATLFRTGQR